MRNWDVVWIRRVGECLLLLISICGIICPKVYAASRALGMHDYRYYDFLDYTAWDFARYEKPKPRKAFKGYLANGFSEKQGPCLYFFPKTLPPQFDKTTLIPLDKAQERIQRINAQTLSMYSKNQQEPMPAAAPLVDGPPAKPEKRIISQAGGRPALTVRGVQEETGAAPLALKPLAPAGSLSPEDILLFLKKKIPPGQNETPAAEVVLPFHVPLNNAPSPILYPSQALYTQE